MSDTKPIIVGLGEALFDIFPDNECLGGAPLNVAVHAHQLGNDGIVASRVGDDELGRQVTRHLRSRDMRTDYLQIDKDHKTGTVNVVIENGEPNYEIVERVAWDAMRFDPRFSRIAGQCDAVCFGTLAQRKSESRIAIQRFVECAARANRSSERTNGAIRLFDLNLRQQFYDGPLIDRSLRLATAAKLNGDELSIASRLLELPTSEPSAAAMSLRQRYDLDFVAITRGADGIIVYCEQGNLESDPVAADTSSGDRVGAGDSTAAALLHGRVRNWPWSRTIRLANTIGAHVASQNGACPPLSAEVMGLLAD